MQQALTIDMARAAQLRGEAFKRERPELFVYYGEDEAMSRLRLLGYAGAGQARVQDPYGGERAPMVIPLSCVFVDAETAEHLTRCAAWIAALSAQAMGGSYSAGTQHYRGKSRR